jgi:uncharacterized Rmd1/YagE family protein
MAKNNTVKVAKIEQFLTDLKDDLSEIKECTDKIDSIDKKLAVLQEGFDNHLKHHQESEISRNRNIIIIISVLSLMVSVITGIILKIVGI